MKHVKNVVESWYFKTILNQQQWDVIILNTNLEQIQ